MTKPKKQSRGPEEKSELVKLSNGMLRSKPIVPKQEKKR
jgi:hypothetical protein